MGLIVYVLLPLRSCLVVVKLRHFHWLIDNWLAPFSLETREPSLGRPLGLFIYSFQESLGKCPDTPSSITGTRKGTVGLGGGAKGKPGQHQALRRQGCV